MAQNIKDAVGNLKTAILADSEVTAWVTSHFGGGATLHVFLGRAAGPPDEGANSTELPALTIENALPSLSSSAEVVSQIATLGAKRTRVTAFLLLVFSFREADHAAAFTERCELIDITRRFFMRNKTLGGAVGAAMIVESRWQDVQEPLYQLYCAVELDYTLEIP